MTTDDRIAARRAELTTKRQAIPDDDQLPASITRGELAAMQQQRAMIDRQIAALDRAVSTLAALGSAEADERWRDQLTEWREVLCTERIEIKSPIRDPKLLGLEQNLKLSIGSIDRGPEKMRLADGGRDLTTLRLGELMIAAGYEVTGADRDHNFVGKLPWFGSLTDVEKRISALATQRERAQAALDAVLLSDEERARVEAERTADREAFNALVVKISTDGTHLVAYRDRAAFMRGEPYAATNMTPVERRAFERMDAAHRGTPAPGETVTT
jgi:hypothetical protein